MAELKNHGDEFADGKIDLNQFDFSIAACRPKDPSQYDPRMRRAWDVVVADIEAKEGPSDLSLYPGSSEQPCEGCGIIVGVGPRQKAAIEATSTRVIVACLVCAAVLAGSTPGIAHLAHLGNRDR